MSKACLAFWSVLLVWFPWSLIFHGAVTWQKFWFTVVHVQQEEVSPCPQMTASMFTATPHNPAQNQSLHKVLRTTTAIGILEFVFPNINLSIKTLFRAEAKALCRQALFCDVPNHLSLL